MGAIIGAAVIAGAASIAAASMNSAGEMVGPDDAWLDFQRSLYGRITNRLDQIKEWEGAFSPETLTLLKTGAKQYAAVAFKQAKTELNERLMPSVAAGAGASANRAYSGLLSAQAEKTYNTMLGIDIKNKEMGQQESQGLIQQGLGTADPNTGMKGTTVGANTMYTDALASGWNVYQGLSAQQQNQQIMDRLGQIQTQPNYINQTPTYRLGTPMTFNRGGY